MRRVMSGAMVIELISRASISPRLSTTWRNPRGSPEPKENPVSQSTLSAVPAAIWSRADSISAVKSYSTSSPKWSSSNRTTENAIQGGNDRGESGGATDAQFFQPLDEACLGVSRQRRGFVTLRLEFVDCDGLPLRESRKSGLGGSVIDIALFIVALLVGSEESTEGDDGATRGEFRGGARNDARCSGGN